MNKQSEKSFLSSISSEDVEALISLAFTISIQQIMHDLQSLKNIKAIDNAEIICGVFLDQQEAFDTVDHEILLSKLEHYCVCGVPLKWCKTFLTK